MSRAVVYETFGGPEVLELREVPEPHAGPGEVRVHVTAAGLNPMDWGIASRPELAARFGISVPSGFGYDFGGIETAETALALGVPPERISTIAAGPNPPAAFARPVVSTRARTPWSGSTTRSSSARSPYRSPRPSRSGRSAMP